MFWSFLKSCTPSWNVFRNFCKSNKVVSLDTNGTKQVNESSIDLIGDSINQINKDLSIKGVYKTYEIRKLVYRQILREKNELDELKKFYLSCFLYDREHIKKKLKTITKKTYKDIDTEFDSKIKNIMQKFNIQEKCKIKDNYSYNLVVIDCFTLAYT